MLDCVVCVDGGEVALSNGYDMVVLREGRLFEGWLWKGGCLLSCGALRGGGWVEQLELSWMYR